MLHYPTNDDGLTSEEIMEKKTVMYNIKRKKEMERRERGEVREGNYIVALCIYQVSFLS